MAKLILLTLPIGNLEDITIRAKNSLERGKCFFAEDTRTFRSFLSLLGIEITGKEILSFHDNQKIDRSGKLLELLSSGQDVYVVSEAGSPIISDPAFPLIRMALSEGFEIDTVPGVSSVLAALELSGLPPYPFTFHGFIPREKEKRKELLKALPLGTHIFFESPVRCEKTLAELCELSPDSRFALAREITKKFQTVHRFLGRDFSKEEITYKGEFVILVTIDKGQESQVSNKIRELSKEYMEGRGGVKLLSKILSEILGEDTKQIYNKLTHKD